MRRAHTNGRAAHKKQQMLSKTKKNVPSAKTGARHENTTTLSACTPRCPLRTNRKRAPHKRKHAAHQKNNARQNEKQMLLQLLSAQIHKQNMPSTWKYR